MLEEAAKGVAIAWTMSLIFSMNHHCGSAEG